jgi:hypothetical protein
LKAIAVRDDAICRDCLEICMSIVARHEPDEFEAMVARARSALDSVPRE